MSIDLKEVDTVTKNLFLTQGLTVKSSPTVLPRLPQALSSCLRDTKAALPTQEGLKKYAALTETKKRKAKSANGMNESWNERFGNCKVKIKPAK